MLIIKNTECRTKPKCSICLCYTSKGILPFGLAEQNCSRHQCSGFSSCWILTCQLMSPYLLNHQLLEDDESGTNSISRESTRPNLNVGDEPPSTPTSPAGTPGTPTSPAGTPGTPRGKQSLAFWANKLRKMAIAGNSEADQTQVGQEPAPPHSPLPLSLYMCVSVLAPSHPWCDYSPTLHGVTPWSGVPANTTQPMLF